MNKHPIRYLTAAKFWELVFWLFYAPLIAGAGVTIARWLEMVR